MATNGFEPHAENNGQVHLEEVSIESKDLKNELRNEASHFMDNVISFRLATQEDKANARKTESFFDTVSRREGMDKNVSFVRLSKILKVTLEWKSLTYRVAVGKKKKMTTKTILDSLSGQVPPGRLVAVMGPTGSGKTSLINALAGRLPAGGALEGEILVNGQPRNRSFSSFSAYVMQDDILFSNLTVRETFEFACNMRLGANISKETKEALVTQIIMELGLSKAQDTRIGNEMIRGVSGGERKRTNIGIELLSGATLIFLDEPTSGLDAFQAANVVEALWTLAGNGRTVISTIHQPRSSIYQMFDLLLLLSEGKCMYYGPAKDAVAYFSSVGFACPKEFNPADFFLDVVSMDYRSTEDELYTRKRINLLAELYQQEGHAMAGRKSIDASVAQEFQQATAATAFPNNPMTEFWLLLRRSWKQTMRDRIPQIITLMQTIIIGFFLAALYSNMDESKTPVQDETGILFFVCIFSAMGAMFGALSSFPTERGVVNRERASKCYHVSPYYLARFISDMPLRVGQGLLFGCIIYWITGLNPSASAFFIFVAVLIVEGLASQALGIAISAGAPNEKAAMALAPAITVILILFGGFYANTDTIPVWLSWIKYLSHLYWAFYGLVVNNFAGRDDWGSVTGDEIVAQFGFDKNKLWLPFVALIALMIGLNLMGYILLRRSKAKFLPMAHSSASTAAKKSK